LTPFHTSVRPVLEELRTRYPDSPFLALGQTIWWDEPMKAVLRRMLDELGLGGRMVLGVHDTDYFAKVAARRTGHSRFELLPHNDGSTKDLWSAAGEIARLFGSETFPTRHDFVAHGVPFSRLAKSGAQDNGGRREFVDTVTEAWGWRGLVYTGGRDLIVHNVTLQDIGDALEHLLKWGFEGTGENIVDACCREEARQLAERLLQWTRDYRASAETQSLTGLYQELFPRLFELLLGSPPQDVGVCCTTHLLRLTPETASLPRFRFVDLFLNEKTRTLAAEAYNQAVAGSEMYTLERFGLGALPFDVIDPVHGRGTLRVTLRAVHIETKNPIRIPLKQPIDGIGGLAEVLTAELGDRVTLVGKAVALISMLSQEFIFVFNEEGSAYVRRTRKMNDFLRSHGIALDMRPILRLRHHTWDALEVAQSTITLPDHLASTFGQRQIPSRDFALRWKKVVEEQGQLLDNVKQIRALRDLLAFLAGRNGGEWEEAASGYERAKSGLREIRDKAAAIDAEVRAAYARLAGIKRSIEVAEKQKGDHFRSTADWTPERLAERAAFGSRISQLLADRRSALDEIRDKKHVRLAVERGPEAVRLRSEVDRIELSAEMERLRLVRNADLTRAGLPHTDHRPTAWWLPMVDPSGRWFQRISETTEVYTEPLLSS
jgi:hypothetical protein